jgi:hypothetical protein
MKIFARSGCALPLINYTEECTAPSNKPAPATTGANRRASYRSAFFAFFFAKIVFQFSL